MTPNDIQEINRSLGRYQLTPVESDLLVKNLPGIGMTDREIEQYSLLRAIRSASSPDHKPRDGLEFEASRTVAEKLLGKDPQSYDAHHILVPPEILQRDLNVASAGAGGHLVEMTNVSFIDILRNRSVVLAMGATRLPGLRGDAAIPKQTGAATAEWLDNETQQTTETQQTFTQLPLSPKTVAAYTELSRLLTLQSTPAAEGIVTRDLAAVVALGMDTAAINGSGASGQPLGILQAPNIATANGSSVAWPDILECQSDTLGANALVNLGTVGYVTTTSVASLMMQRVKFSSTDSPLWRGSMAAGEVSGFRAMSSGQMPTATLLFGDWSQLIVAEWGLLEVEINPFTNFQAGIVGVRAMYSVDIGLRHEESFCAITSIT